MGMKYEGSESNNNNNNNGFSNDGERPDGDGDGDGGSSNFGGGLLVASVSECDSSAFDDGLDEGEASDGSLGAEDDTEDSDNGSDTGGERLRQRHGSVYEDRFRQRSPASQQFMALADTVASDVAKGGSTAHSHLIQRMTLVSHCTELL